MTTSLFGRSKFGTFKFGATTLSQPRYILEVDWDGDGLFDGVNEGVNLQGVSIDRGRKYTISAEGNAFEMEETGRFSATLLDPDRRYDPYNSSSALYGLLIGGSAFRVSVRAPSGTIYPLMAGSIDEPVSFSERGMTMARITGMDGWGYLRDQLKEVSIPLQEDAYAEELIRQVLEAAGWPRTWGSELGDGVDARPYFWVEDASPAEVLHNIAHNELGIINIGASGQMVYKPRLTIEAEVMTLTQNQVTAVQRRAPGEVIRNLIKVVSRPRSEQALQVVWSIPQRLEVAAGATIEDVYAEFEYNGVTVPAKDIVEPVAVTDYDAYVNEDGSGTDLTANISVSIDTTYGTRAKLRVTNSGGSLAYVRMQLRGIPLIDVGSVSFEYRDDGSIRQFGPRPFNFYIDQNVNVARQYRDLLGMYLALMKNSLIVDLLPDEDVQFAADLGDILRVTMSAYGINGLYRLIRISHRWDDSNGIVVRTRWWLEPYTQLFTGVQVPFQIPVQIGSIV